MSDEVLSCSEVVEFFTAEVASVGTGGLLPEGVQNAFVNLHSRLARGCPVERCERSSECVLQVDGAPKRFDGPEGKLRYLRMKVRTEGVRAHRRHGHDVLTSAHVSLVGDVEERRVAAGPDPMAALADAVEVDAALAEALAALGDRLRALELDQVRGGPANVAASVHVALTLVERTCAAPVPDGVEERRNVVRELLLAAAPQSADGSAAAVRQRHKRLRAVVRQVLEHAGGEALADVWVPLEHNMQRGAAGER